MIKSGVVETLHISRFTDFGAFLTNGTTDAEGLECEVLLPYRYLTDTMEVGDGVEVFVYHDSEGRLVAVTDKPKTLPGKIGVLEVVDVASVGAFLDWGLPKDLFLPFKNQTYKVSRGEKVVVAVYVDVVTEREVATMFVGRYLQHGDYVPAVGEEVTALIAERTNVGFKAIVNEKCWGLLYSNQIFKPLEVGDTVKAYVREITEEGRIDLLLNKEGIGGLTDAASCLRELLVAAGGRLDLCDNSEPQKIYEATQLSKKSFKRAVGTMMKSGEVCQGEGFIELIKK